MTQKLNEMPIRVGVFDTVEAADRAIRRLLAAGFSKDQLAVVCPAKFEKHFRPEVSQRETPAPANPGTTLATGGVVGASLGGLALAATAITGGVGAVAVAALIGGGALAGAFSNLIVSKGYEEEADDSYKQAIEHGQIVVGVEVPGGEEAAPRLAEAQHILDEEGARSLEHAKDRRRNKFPK